ncbi:MAG TPA: hypothetical protein VNV41_13920 [Candidatus Acidoferrales bacterium]|jgi:hypothetical protein|nr:hypothetical protein [Candidatus Acidoferrales bacterium]
MPRKPKLTVEQLELVGQFNDAEYEYLKLSFAQAAKKVGTVFPNTAAGREFKRQAKEVFDGERQK